MLTWPLPWFLLGPPGMAAGSLVAAGPWLPAPLVMPLLLIALTVAVLGMLDTLLAGSVVDGRLRQPGTASVSLRAQGLAGLVAGALCSMPVSPSVQRSLALLDVAPRWQRGALAYALAWLAWLLLVPQALGWLPVSAIGAVLLLPFANDTDAALERAEDRLLNQCGMPTVTLIALTLGDTQLAEGLSPDDLARLAAEMQQLPMKRAM